MSSPSDRSSGSSRPGEKGPVRDGRTRVEYAQVFARQTDPVAAPDVPAKPSERSNTVYGHPAPFASPAPAAERVVVVQQRAVVGATVQPSVPSPAHYGGAASLPATGPGLQTTAPMMGAHRQPARALTPEPTAPNTTTPVRVPELLATDPVQPRARTERPTEFVDMHELLRTEGPQPRSELGDPPRFGRGVIAEPAPLPSADDGPSYLPVPARSDSDIRQRKFSVFEARELERSLKQPSLRGIVLAGACVVAVGMMALSFLHKPSAPVAAAPVRAPVARPVVAEQSAVGSPPAPAPAQPAAVHALGAERGGATAQSAAALYMKGQYKEALAEYRLLAGAYPEDKAYAEFARILKRKLFDTCVRTQPNRREQCKQL